MKRGMGIFAFLAAMVAGLHFGVTASAPKAATNSNALAANVISAVEPRETTCSEFAAQGNGNGSEGNLALLVDRFLYGASGQPGTGAGQIPKGIRFIVATVPDPLHTHLNLQFDRTIEAIQEGAQDENYTYDSSWLPWKQEAVQYSGRADQLAEQNDTLRRENCPGLILFRKSIKGGVYDDVYGQGLFVFVVAEKPTTGIDHAQWNNAVGWIASRANRETFDGTLRVLGPTFSGSVASMSRALIELQTKQPSFTNVLLYTGTIRGCVSFGWLKATLSRLRSLPVRVDDFNENDAIQIDRYFKYLTERRHSLSEVAILSEDETAYGGLPDIQHDQEPDPCQPQYSQQNRPLHLYYPRDISAVRSAYQEQSIFTASTSDATGAAHVVLQPESGRSSHSDTDTIATFSGPNSALAQEAQLYGIVDSLKTHGIRFVILRSTSTLDYLFLTRFLHRAYPDAFIVTMGPDMLFGREIDSTEFRGVIALTAFPLLPRGQDWTSPTSATVRHAHRVFGSDSMEGTYLASRFLITDPKASPGGSQPYHHGPKPNISDYAPPFWSLPQKNFEGFIQPSTWLSVVGRDGYWPLAVLDETFSSTHAPPSNLASVAGPASSSAVDKPGVHLRISLSPAWKICCGLAVLCLCLHLFACRCGWNNQNLSMFIQFMPLSKNPNRQLFLMSVGWAAVGSVLVLMYLCSARIGYFLEPGDFSWVVILRIFALIACIGIVLDISLRSHSLQGSIPMQVLRALLWITFCLLLVGLAYWAGWKIFDYSDPSGVPTAYRSVHITSGVSPMVSLLIMFGGLYFWFWNTLAGLALLDEGKPVLPRRTHLPRSLARISDEIADNVESIAVPLPSARRSSGRAYLIPIALVTLQVLALRRPLAESLDSILHSLENTSFNISQHVLLAIAFCLLMLECVQLLGTWFSLKRLLLALSRTPLRRTFSALQGLSMHSLWSMSGTGSRARYAIFSHQLESLNHLRNMLDSFAARDCGNKEIRKVIRDACDEGKRFVEKRSDKADLAMVNDTEGRQMRETFGHCTEQVLDTLILPEWCSTTATLDLREEAQKESSKEVFPLSEAEPVRRAEEFVCLIYVGYLQNLLARMRTMVLSLLGIFAAVAFSLAFYPYTPRPAIALSLLLLLFVLGSVVATVYAGLDRDPTLSNITDTEPGKLGLDFWIRLASFIVVPVMGLLVAQFPEITDFVVSWVQPSLNAAK